MSARNIENLPSPMPVPEARVLPRWIKWWLGGTGIALCLAILALWGLHGPSYILDLITAYCF